MSTNLPWLKKAGPAVMPQLPAKAKGANSIFAADLSFLQGYFDNLEKAGKINAEERKGIDAFQLQNIELICYGKINDDASSSQSVCQLNNWDWRNAIALLFDENGIFAKARQKALQSQSMSNLRQLALSVNMLAQENDETLPTLQQVKEYDGMNEKFFTQPGTELKYIYNDKIAGKPLGEFNDPTNTVLFYEAEFSKTGFRLVAFLDGHVEAVNEADWKELLKLNGM